MGVRAFVDTNVLVYLYDTADAKKQQLAQDIMLDDGFDLVVSAQVLNEFYVTVTRKIATPMSLEQAAEAIDSIAELEVIAITRNLVVDALRTGRRHKLSHWDALILEAASRSGSSQLLTEDMATGSTLNGVTIVNPFELDAGATHDL